MRSAILAAMDINSHHSSSQHKPLNFARLALVSAVVACSLAQASAAKAKGDVTMAGVVGAGTAASCTAGALQTALNGGGLVTFNCGPANATIISNTYVVNANTEVDGGDKITLDGENLRQHFIVQPGVSLTLRRITLTRGNSADGGSIYNQGATVGGSAQADVNTGTFSTNKAQLFGGVYMNNDSSVITVTNSVFDKNTATSQGGGMNVSSVANTVRVANTTFSGNISADNKGGGIYNNGALELVNVTLKGNTNGLFNFGAGESTQIRNSVLDNAPSLNCDSDGIAVTSGGRNFSNDGSCALGGPGDQSGDGLDPKLGPRQTTFTAYHLPLVGSPLINAATNCTAFDQRYVLRFDACDIGAVEYNGLLAQARLPIAIR